MKSHKAFIKRLQEGGTITMETDETLPSLEDCPGLKVAITGMPKPVVTRGPDGSVPETTV